MSRSLLLIPLLIGLLGVAHAARADQRLVHSERSLYREVLVYENGDVRCMCFTRNCRVGRQSCIDTRHPDRLVMRYPQMMLGALFVNPAPQSVLIVGLGGVLPALMATEAGVDESPLLSLTVSVAVKLPLA